RYYGYDRWLSRDPIEEEGGVNVYAFVQNSPVDHLDFIGLWKIIRTSQRRANVIAEENDSVTTLARQTGLDEDEFEKWLDVFKYDGPSFVPNLFEWNSTPIPKHKDQTVCPGTWYTVPNVVLIHYTQDSVSIKTDAGLAGVTQTASSNLMMK